MADPTIKELSARIKDLEEIIARIPGGGVVDPAPDPWGGGGNPWGPWSPLPRPRPQPFPFPFPWPPNADPSPIDLSRLTRTQLEMTREMLKTEKFRIEAMEKLLDEQISALK